MILAASGTSGPGWTEIVIAVATGVLAVGVLATVWAAWGARSAVRETVKARHTQLFIDIARRWDDSEMQKAKQSLAGMNAIRFQEHYRRLYKRKGPELYGVERFANFFEDLGLLEKMGNIEIKWIEESLGSSVTGYWEMWKLATIEQRDATGPTGIDATLLYENWELLAHKIEARKRTARGGDS